MDERRSSNWNEVQLPLVSICIPTFEPDLRYLADLLDSLQTQDLKDFEVIISDDQSRNSEAIFGALDAAPFPWRAVRGTKRLGMARNWNEVVQLARGTYVIVPGQDDLFNASGLSKLVTFAVESKVDVAFGSQYFVDTNGDPVENPSRSAPRRPLFPSGALRLPARSVVEIGLLYGNVLGDPCNALIAKSAFLSSGGFSEEYEHALDLELWLRLATSDASVAHFSVPVAAHRTHAHSATAGHVKDGSSQRDRVRLFEQYSALLIDSSSWNRAVARLHTHRAYDRLIHSTRSLSQRPKMKGGFGSRFAAMLYEIALILKLVSPRLPAIQQPGG